MPGFLGRACVAALLCVTPLLLGVVHGGPLPTDPAAMPDWQGSVNFSGSNPPLFNETLEVTVDYAVYAPSSFASSAALNFPADPSGGTNFIYAYQLIHSTAGSANVANLSVGFSPGAIPNSSTWIGSDPAGLASPVSPLFESLIDGGSGYKQNALWVFFPNLGGNNYSEILYFASEFAPGWINASMQGSSSTIATANLPSPMHAPEPGACTLAAMGALCLLAVRYFRGRSR